MRKMATVQRVVDVRPISDADAIEVVQVLGWEVVTQKGEYSVGDTVVYVEPDSWIPHEVFPHLSKGKEPREYQGVKGEKLRTIRLRGQYSQGLILSMEAIPGGIYEIGQDVSELLNIVKYEPPIPAQLAGLIRGVFPSGGKQTEQDRIQNVHQRLLDCELLQEDWWVEEKIHGTSMSVLYIENSIHVCSRNLSVKLEDENNSMVKVAKDIGIISALEEYCQKHQIQLQLSGELAGDGINKNQLKINGHKWFIFDIYDIDNRKWLPADQREVVIEDLKQLGAKIDIVPVVGCIDLRAQSVQDILEMAEGKSLINPKVEREGLVFKLVSDGDVSFKSISRKWLLKGHDE